ncbi:MAG: hypothetical protein DSY55_05180 [Clostridia bacterium]|nr:MAG: hypothetical protein DSY55_05180 [Clostridia bacterium]
MSHAFFPANQPAPEITLEAVESGRVITPHSPDARYLALVFQSQKTARALADVQDTVRAKHPAADDVRIVSVVDLREVPRMFRGMAKSALKRAYESAGAHLPEGWAPQDYVVILPDWKGEFFDAFGLKDANEEAAAVVIDAQGRVLGSHQGAGLGQFVLEALD